MVRIIAAAMAASWAVAAATPVAAASAKAIVFRTAPAGVGGPAGRVVFRDSPGGATVAERIVRTLPVRGGCGCPH